MSVNFKELQKIEEDLKKMINVREKILKISERFFKFFLPFEINSLKFLKEYSLGV